MNKDEKQLIEEVMKAKLEMCYSTVSINDNAIEKEVKFNNIKEENHLK